MQISSRFTIAVHVLTAIEYFKDMDRVNSGFLAGSVGVNPVIVRTVLSQLREAGIVTTLRGSSGANLAKPLNEISLFDIYQAVDCVNQEEGLFHFHEHPNPDCPVGRNIQKSLGKRLDSLQKSLEDELKSISLADIVADTVSEIDQEKQYPAGSNSMQDEY